jgi:hypothetical protein
MLNERIYGHFMLAHPQTENYSDFVSSLDLTGDNLVDEAMMQHHAKHHHSLND